MSRPKEQAGLTLVELVTVIAIIAILASIAFPSFQRTLASNRVTSTSNSLLGLLQLARSEAMTMGRTVTVCPSTDQATCTQGATWNNGMIALRNGSSTPVRIVPDISNGTSVSASSGANSVSSLTFNANGTISAATSFGICNSSGHVARQIDVNLLGHATIVAGQCP
ncbi:GspH/FimT family pseudopilin [Pseudomonas sp. PDM18]|uniref:GspH/FimT family pseudopilin n=1 Tax=Pseudomonas sp. PDM18 TaxID=2769253 RepID=UPI00177F1D72|nr:GspH/FimT family pseudopilin [Pseudomonas sp. PDM18]MBD9676888.1 GspH/FimT family pseudopilin [Pseudomonas sp. PDM18]